MFGNKLRWTNKRLILSVPVGLGRSRSLSNIFSQFPHHWIDKYCNMCYYTEHYLRDTFKCVIKKLLVVFTYNQGKTNDRRSSSAPAWPVPNYVDVCLPSNRIQQNTSIGVYFMPSFYWWLIIPVYKSLCHKNIICSIDWFRHRNKYYS